MGRQHDLPLSRAPETRHCSRLLCFKLLLLLALAVCAVGQWTDPLRILTRSRRFGDAFTWNTLSSYPLFNWVDCFEGHMCAKFEVPLDYSNPNGLKANIAVVKFPSKYSHDDPSYRGPIFYNPGGPGASGAAFIRSRGRFFADLLGDEYDHIGFDPRGVGATTPAMVLFTTEAERRTWGINSVTDRTQNLTVDGVGMTLARARILGELAAQRANVTASNVGTAQVAMDIMAMNKALGRDNVMFWGGSYGTILGITLAAMYPDKIERLVADSVMDATTYYATAWDKNLDNTDDALEWLFRSCSVAPTCALHAPTIDGVRDRYQRILDDLKRHPIAVVDGRTYGVVDYDMAQNIVFRSLYHAWRNFPPLMSALKDLENGDGRALYALSGRDDSMWSCEPTTDPVDVIWSEVGPSIFCGDGEPVHDDVEELETKVRQLREKSSWGDMMGLRIICAGWKIRVNNRFAGPFIGKTRNPILFMNNVADPVAPLASANRTAKRFPGSSVVAVNAPGHGAVVTPSACALQHLRAYVRDGKLPPNEFTMCQTDKPIFPLEDLHTLSGGSKLHSLVEEFIEGGGLPYFHS